MQVCDIFENYSQALSSIDLGNTDNLILIHQALYRIFALANKEWFVLHGSGVAVDGKGIVFGDDGKSVGKTTQSLQLYKELKDRGGNVKYVADEFVLYKNGYIYPNKYCPIHNKPSSEEYVKRLFGEYREFLTLPEKEFVDNPVPLHAIVCPTPSGITKLTKLYGENRENALRCTAYSHLVKLHNPTCDRYSLFTGKRESRKIKDVREFVKSYPIPKEKVSVYELQIEDPKFLLPILMRYKVFMTKPVKNHISCGGILFDAEKEKAYLIYKVARKEWLLPKGHTQEGEDLTQTALREVYEETGYKNVRLLDVQPISTTEYDFELEEEPNFQHHKVVHWYAMQLKDDKRDEDTQTVGEGLEGNWFNIGEVVEKLAYENEKEVAKLAIEKFNS